jgi:hypothetical protein
LSTKSNEKIADVCNFSTDKIPYLDSGLFLEFVEQIVLYVMLGFVNFMSVILEKSEQIKPFYCKL